MTLNYKAIQSWSNKRQDIIMPLPDIFKLLLDDNCQENIFESYLVIRQLNRHWFRFILEDM